MAFDYAQMGAGPANQFQGVNLGGQYDTINKAVTQGRPGALDYLFKMLDAMGSTNQGNMAYDQYSQMRPYMTDEAQQGRASFNAAFPYLADPYMWNRNKMNEDKERWDIEKPYAQEQTNWRRQQISNPYINPALTYSSYGR